MRCNAYVLGLVFSATIGLSRFPIYVFVRRLMRFYVQLIQRAPVAVQPH
jgi:ABC-type amino acid transport system permease subunit